MTGPCLGGYRGQLYPFLWESAQQPPGRWHGSGEGPAHYFADTPDGAWAELLRHEEITDVADLATIRRRMWVAETGDIAAEPVRLPARLTTGDLDTYPPCQVEARRLRARGISRYCPTEITRDRAATVSILSRLGSAMRAHAMPGAWGIHLEGPWISAEDGYRGVHQGRLVRLPDRDEFRELERACGGAIRIVTLAPELPVPSLPGEYRVGLDVSARGGLLSYAPDTTPLVGGAHVEWRWREVGATSNEFYFAEYLHAVDKTGGVGAIGYGGRGEKISGSIGLAVPWGRSEGRRDVLIPDHTLALHGELRLGMFRDVMIDRAWAMTFEGSLVGGLNLAKAAIRLGNKIGDSCGSGDTSCKETPDANPRWPLTHVMLQVGVSLGFRGRHPRYQRAEVFAPMGGS